jgi:glucosamine-phosphate N-acetyltransferase
MEVRKINTQDFSIIYLLEQFKKDSLNISQKQFEKFISQLDKHHNIFVIEEQQKIICCGSIFIENKLLHNLGKVGHIEDVITDSQYRGQGLGKKIIESLVNYGRQQGCYKVILNCTNNNILFYEKCGFTRKEHQMSLYFL